MVKRAIPSREELFEILQSVKDPEVPVLSVVELGIIRDIVASDAGVGVTITPTYSGCPAMNMIALEIEVALERQDIRNSKIKTVLSPLKGELHHFVNEAQRISAVGLERRRQLAWVFAVQLLRGSAAK